MLALPLSPVCVGVSASRWALRRANPIISRQPDSQPVAGQTD